MPDTFKGILKEKHSVRLNVSEINSCADGIEKWKDDITKCTEVDMGKSIDVEMNDKLRKVNKVKLYFNLYGECGTANAQKCDYGSFFACGFAS